MTRTGRGGARWVERSTLSAGVVLAAVLLGMVNYLGFKYHARFDWTSSRLYTLSEKSLAVVEGLDRDVEIVVLLDPVSPLYPAVEELVARYEAASPRIHAEIVDAQRNPARAQQLLERYRTAGLSSVVFTSGDEVQVVEEADLAEYDYGAMQYGQEPTVESFLGEQLFTGAILDLVESRKPKVLFLTGHGEARPEDYSPDGASGAKDLLERDNFELEEWASLGQAHVPEGTDLVIVAAPRARLLAQELEVLGGAREGASHVDVGLGEAAAEEQAVGGADDVADRAVDGVVGEQAQPQRPDPAADEVHTHHVERVVVAEPVLQSHREGAQHAGHEAQHRRQARLDHRERLAQPHGDFAALERAAGDVAVRQQLGVRVGEPEDAGGDDYSHGDQQRVEVVLGAVGRDEGDREDRPVDRGGHLANG